MGRPPIPDSIVARAAELFVSSHDMTTEEICIKLNEEIQRRKDRGELEGDAPHLVRENVYRLIRTARESGMIQFVSPLADQMPARLANKFGHGAEQFTVVDILSHESNEQVAAKAAELVYQELENLSKQVGPKERNYVSLGLGPGRGTSDFCRHLGMKLGSLLTELNLRLVAIAAGAPAYQPEYASSSFYNLFPPRRVAGRVGFFAETLVASSEFAKPGFRNLPGIAEAFKEKKDINVVVNSMGDLLDPHDLLGDSLDKARIKHLEIHPQLRGLLEKRAKYRTDPDELRFEKETIGSVQYRPFDLNGPIRESSKSKQLRACTLYELQDFRERVSLGMPVFLIARSCGKCGLTRARALRPLLTNKDLKVWSHIVMDYSTAKELLIGA
jgi:hypothetical protein